MKKTLLFVVAALLCLTVAFSFVGCGGNVCTAHTDADGDGICDTEGCNEPVESKPTPPAADVFNEKGELVLYKGGKPTFQFIVAEDAQSQLLEVKELAETLTKLSDGEVKYGDISTPTADVEILIGTVSNRGSEYIFDAHDWGMNGYMVKQIGTKIVVIGGSEDALAKAVKYVKEQVFGIKKSTPPFTDFVMQEKKNYDKPQTGYKTTSIKIDGVSISEYVIYHGRSTVEKNVAIAFRDALYENEGIWLEVKDNEPAADVKAVKFIASNNDGQGDGYTVTTDNNGSIIFDCEYSYKFEETAAKTYMDKIVATGKASVSLAKNAVIDIIDLRNIYYEDFGANGTDTVCDFEAIRKTHEHANRYGHIVNADPKATYWIGTYTGNKSIVVQTDTNWNGCNFVINDRGIMPTDASYSTPVFHIAPTYPGDKKTFSGSTVPVKSLPKDSTELGYAPGFPALVVIKNLNVRHFIRTGSGQNSDTDGYAQQEMIIVDANGNIDPTTPLQWDFDVITKMTVYRTDETPITVSGGGEGVYTTITTIFNSTPFPKGDCSYLQRNIYVTRSNATITNFVHVVEGEGDDAGQPYYGFTSVMYANNVTFDGITIQRYKKYMNPHTGNSIARSYEITAEYSNNTRYVNCQQSNFFHFPGGQTASNGVMGTNYCKNFTLENSRINNFDAHRGVYNLNVIGCEIVYVSFIGGGKLTIKDTTIMCTRNDSQNLPVVALRSDYGSTFDGELHVDNVVVKYTNNSKHVVLIQTSWSNSWHGYYTFLPDKIYINRVKLVQIEFVKEGGEEVERKVGENLHTLYIYPAGFSTTSTDYSSPSTSNPYTGTTYIGVTNCGKLNIFIPYAPMFKNLESHFDTDSDGICNGSDYCNCKNDNYVSTLPPKAE